MHIADSEARARVAAAIKDRRDQLRLRQEDVSAAGGPSKAVLFQIENGAPKGYSDATIGKLEDALQWRRGSVRAIVEGRAPTPAQPEASGPPASDEPKAEQMTFTGPKGLTVTIMLGPDQKLSDIAAEMPGVIEMVSKMFDGLAGTDKLAEGSTGLPSE